MTSPTPEERAGEAFADSAAEAVQTAIMAYRLVMAIADAARRHQQSKQKGTVEDLPSAEEAVGEVTEVVKRMLPTDISAALMREADWPQLAQQLMALRQAGVDLDQILPRVGEIAVNVRDQVTAKAQQTGDQWVRLVRETLPAGPLREAILTSPAWPEMAATMAQLEERGLNVREVLAAAHNEVLAAQQAVAEALGGTAEPTMSRDAQLSYGPLTTGLDLPRDLDLSDRERAFRQLAISPEDNQMYIRWVREAMSEHEREADRLVASRQWPLVAYRMAHMESEGESVREQLAGLAVATGWQEGSSAQPLMTVLNLATDGVLAGKDTHEGVRTRQKVNTRAARSTSTSVGPRSRDDLSEEIRRDATPEYLGYTTGASGRGRSKAK